jgi:general stress protein 26
MAKNDTDKKDTDKIWELMESISFCMLSNWDGEKLHSRPMGAFVRRDEGAIYFFTDERAHKDDEIRRFSRVCLAFADTKGQKYVSVSGTAEISRDREKIEELWAIPAKVWWKSPDNPNIRLIKVIPEEAEYWDAPGNLISGIKVALALVKGTYPDAGEHHKVAL